MQIIKSAGLIALGLLQLGLAAPAPAEAEAAAADPILTIGTLPAIPTAILTVTKRAAAATTKVPASCTSVVSGTTKGPSCYTHTTTLSAKSCPAVTNLMCPMYIAVTTKNVPCSKACCPTTGTKTVTRACATGCVIPTETIIVTTGCKTTAIPTATLPTAILTWG